MAKSKSGVVTPQEMRTTAYKSKDPIMLGAFTAPEELSDYFNIIETIDGLNFF